MSRQSPDAFDELDDELHGLFTRATADIAPRDNLAESVQQRLVQGGSVRTTGVHRSPSIAAALSAFLVVALLAGVFIWLRPAGGGRVAGVPTATPAAPAAPFRVTAVSMTVSPTSIAGMPCGHVLTVTYTVTFHLAANGPGGHLDFEYTANNGRSSTATTIVVNPGQTTASYSFVWSGPLPTDHTYPEQGGVIVHHPNAISSPLLGPSGRCS